MVKRIHTNEGGHSFIDLSRAEDKLYGPMIKITYRHPEVGEEMTFNLTQHAATELISTISVALEWMNPNLDDLERMNTDDKTKKGTE